MQNEKNHFKIMALNIFLTVGEIAKGIMRRKLMTDDPDKFKNENNKLRTTKEKVNKIRYKKMRRGMELVSLSGKKKLKEQKNCI